LKLIIETKHSVYIVECEKYWVEPTILRCTGVTSIRTDGDLDKVEKESLVIPLKNIEMIRIQGE
jgi:hypothetical protein